MENNRISPDIALDLLHAGLSVLPAGKAEKRPSIGKWNSWRERQPTENEVKAWFANLPDALCLICGKVSDNLEIIDFDNHGELFGAWCEKISPELLTKLVIEQTPSGGYHVAYRCSDEVGGNMKLAQGEREGKIVSLIETRGNGGLVLTAPTNGYVLKQGKYTNLPVITSDERKSLLETAFAMNEQLQEQKPQNTVDGNDAEHFIERPGDAFNRLGNVRSLLLQSGWNAVSIKDGSELFRRPGKNDGGHSASLKDGVFYVFSTNAHPFEAGKAYSPFQVYATLRHGGDFTAAAHDLFLNGYGSADEFTDIDLSQLNISSGDTQKVEPVKPESTFLTLRELMKKHPAMRKPVIHGLLREGETMNIIAAPKVGKSWLAMDLAISVAAGIPWFGFPCEQGRVLYIDNELHGETSAARMPKVIAAKGLDIVRIDELVIIDNQRGRLQNINGLGQMLEAIKALNVKLVIIDAFYRALPPKTDENDNGSIAQLYNSIDQYANYLGCSFVMIHHTSKGNQAMKSVTDVGAGAGSQARAADSHLVLRPHDEEKVVVLDSGVRSFPPVEPICMRWNYPLWEMAPELDPRQLMGRAEEPEKRGKPTIDSLAEAASSLIVQPIGKTEAVAMLQTELGVSRNKAREIIDAAIYLELLEEKFITDPKNPLRHGKMIAKT